MWWLNLISGCVAGLVSSFVFYPLDTFEARQQIDPNFPHQNNLWRGMKKIWQLEGMAGFFIGWQAGLIGVAVNWAIYFCLYAKFQHFFQEGFRQQQLFVDLIAGICTGVCTSILVNPFWVVKCKIIHLYSTNLYSRKKKPTSWWKVLQETYIVHGIQEFYSGVIPSMCGCLQGAVQFMLYNYIQQLPFVVSTVLDGKGELYISFWNFMIGSMSNLFSTALTFPYQTIRTRIQSNNRKKIGTMNMITQMYIEEGISTFYAGLNTNLIRQVPTSGLMLCVIEIIKRSFS